MRTFLFYSLLVVIFTSCQTKEKPTSLDKAFLQSFKDKDFTVLKNFFPTSAVYKSMGKDIAERSSAEIDSFVSRSNQRLKESWEKINTAIGEKKLDLGKLNIKDVIVYSPFRQTSVQAMVIVYDYEGKTWDDLSLIIHQQGDSTFLLEIPNPIKTFSFADTSLSESSLAKSVIESKKPEFHQAVKKQVSQLIGWAKYDSLNEFATLVLYNGEDKNRAWKTVVNMQDEEESKRAINLLKNVKGAIKDCNEFSYDTIQTERESEGYWIVQPLLCNKKVIRFAFLKIKDKLMLGDIDVETQE